MNEQQIGKSVVIRSYSAGVFHGELVSVELSGDRERVTLKGARRIWRWRGANSVSAIAMGGVDSAAESGYTRVDEASSLVVISEVIERHLATPRASERIVAAGWAK